MTIPHGRIAEKTPNIRTIFSANVMELKGTDGLEGVTLDREVDGRRELNTDGIFLEIGADPNNALAKAHGAKLNNQGEIMVDGSVRTSVEGLFAAGDVSDASGDLKQTITAAAQGAIAATSAYEFVSEHPDRCQIHAVGYKLILGA